MLLTHRGFLLLRIGASCSRRKANRRRHKRLSNNFAASTGDPSIASCGDRVLQAEDAEDLTQGFFALLLERKDLNTVRKEKGRLRSYLLSSLKNFLVDEARHAMAAKRGKGQRLIPLDEIREREHADIERSDRFTADQLYERRWAFTVLEQVMARLREEYRSAGNVRFFDQMKKMLMDEPDRPSQAQVATEFDMTENAVKQAFYRFRQRYQSLLREEIAHTVAIPGDIEDELRHLIAVVRA